MAGLRILQHPAQRRTLVVLSLGQALGGVGNGVALGVGSLLVEQVTGDAAFAGLAATLVTLGGAVLAVPLARLAARRGRRPALTTGALVALAGTATIVVGGALAAWPVVLAGFLGLGASAAVNLQSRFAATDLSVRSHRGRDLSLVVWMTTIGVVVGPQLIPPGDAIGVAVGLPPLVGAYVIVAAMQALTAVALGVGLRPDPLRTAQAMRASSEASMSPSAHARSGASGSTSAPEPSDPPTPPWSDAPTATSAGMRSDAPSASAWSDAFPSPTSSDASAAPESSGAPAASPAPTPASASASPRPTRAPGASARLRDHPRALLAVVVVASAHATMVGIMALTPVHLEHAGHALGVIAITMSAHTAGMYALSPVFGILADRVGRLQTVLLGQALLVGSIVVNVALPTSLAPLSLALLGLGWSAATVAGSTLVTESVPEAVRPRIQGRSDLVQGLVGAAAGGIAGPLLGLAGYAGLSLAMAAFVVAGSVAALAGAARRDDAGSAGMQGAPSGSLRDAASVEGAPRRSRRDQT